MLFSHNLILLSKRKFQNEIKTRRGIKFIILMKLNLFRFALGDLFNGFLRIRFLGSEFYAKILVKIK